MCVCVRGSHHLARVDQSKEVTEKVVKKSWKGYINLKASYYCMYMCKG